MKSDTKRCGHCIVIAVDQACTIYDHVHGLKFYVGFLLFLYVATCKRDGFNYKNLYNWKKKKTFNNSVNQFYHNSFRAPKCQPIDAYPEAFLHSHRSKSIIPICPTDITPDDEDEVETLANHRHPHHKKSTTND